MWEESDELLPHEIGAKQSTTTARETMGAAWTQMWRVENATAEAWNLNEAYRNHSDEVERLTGEKLPTHPNRMVNNTKGRGRQIALERYKKNRENLAKKYPVHADYIMKDLEQYGRDIGSSYQENLHRTYREAPSGIKTGAALLAGAGGAAMLDPPNLLVTAATMGIGTVPNTARAVIGSAIKTGLANAFAEGITLPQAHAYREKIGDPMGQSEISWRLAGAVLGGLGLEAGGRGIWRYGRHLNGDKPILDAKKGVIGYKKASGFSASTDLTPEEMANAALASATSDSLIGRARDGDTKAAVELTQKLGMDEDPTIAGLSKTLVDTEHLDAAKLAPEELKPQVRRAQDQARKHAEAPHDEPPPPRIDPVPAEKGPNLVDVHANPRRTKLPQASVPGTTYKAYGKDYRAENFGATHKDIEFEPEVFQFKRGGDAAGVTDRLQGVTKWEPMYAGRIMVFEYADGRRVIADGHQKLGLLRRLYPAGDKVDGFNGWVFKETDGWKPKEVKALAAKKNLSEGTGDAIDIAKVVRESPDIIDAGLPMSGKPMQHGMALAKLTDEAFAKAESGAIPPRYAALVGEHVPRSRAHIQDSIIDTLIENPPTNVDEARHMINQMVRAPEIFEQTSDLFGVKNQARHLAVERGRILGKALDKMKKKASLFRVLKAEAKKIEEAGNSLNRTGNAKALDDAAVVGELVERLALREGRVSEFLDDAASGLHQGGKMATVVDEFVDAVAKQLDEGGMTSLMASTRPRVRAGVDDPIAEGPELVDTMTKDFFPDDAKPAAAATGKPKGKPGDAGEVEVKTKAEVIKEKELAIKKERATLVGALKKDGIDTQSLEEGTRARQLANILENCKL